MSNHFYKSESHLKKQFPLLQILLPVVAVVSILFIPLIRQAAKDDAIEGPWSEAAGHVLATRISVETLADTKFGGVIFYRAEASVIYERDGSTLSAWVPASRRFTNRAELLFWLRQKKSPTCIVRWHPRNPELVSAVLN